VLNYVDIRTEYFFSRYIIIDIDQLTIPYEQMLRKTDEETKNVKEEKKRRRRRKAFSDWAVGLFALLNALRRYFM